jgi:hypothetical protein
MLSTMTNKSLPTVKRLNEIQDAWMALDAFGPEVEKQRVFKMMEDYPHSFVSVSADLTEGQPMISDSPFSAWNMTLAEAQEIVARHNGRTDVGWCGHLGRWVKLP